MTDSLYRWLVGWLRLLGRGVRGMSAGLHHLQYKVEGALRPSAEWFDHQIDAQWQWPRRGRGSFVERGVLSALTIRPGAAVLELCCGDGFSTRHFYAPRAGRVVAVDANPEALRHARRFNPAPNVEYRRCDILRELPEGPFDNVVWDTAIHHFTRAEAEAILARIALALRPGGTLSGHTVIEPGSGYRFARQAFADAEDLATLIGSAFRHVCVRTTQEPHRTNLYFFAGEGPQSMPFDADRDDVVSLPG
jgi:SAM-dependent methyltransferase